MNYPALFLTLTTMFKSKPIRDTIQDERNRIRKEMEARVANIKVNRMSPEDQLKLAIEESKKTAMKQQPKPQFSIIPKPVQEKSEKKVREMKVPSADYEEKVAAHMAFAEEYEAAIKASLTTPQPMTFVEQVEAKFRASRPVSQPKPQPKQDDLELQRALLESMNADRQRKLIQADEMLVAQMLAQEYGN